MTDENGEGRIKRSILEVLTSVQKQEDLRSYLDTANLAASYARDKGLDLTPTFDVYQLREDAIALYQSAKSAESQKGAGNLLEVMNWLHQVVNVQERLDGRDLNRVISSDLYRMFKYSPEGKKDRQMERFILMQRLVLLNVAPGDWKSAKQWAQEKFVKYRIWSLKQKGAEWKRFKADWESIGDPPKDHWDQAEDIKSKVYWTLLKTYQRRDGRSQNSQ